MGSVQLTVLEVMGSPTCRWWKANRAMVGKVWLKYDLFLYRSLQSNWKIIKDSSFQCGKILGRRDPGKQHPQNIHQTSPSPWPSPSPPPSPPSSFSSWPSSIHSMQWPTELRQNIGAEPRTNDKHGFTRAGSNKQQPREAHLFQRKCLWSEWSVDMDGAVEPWKRWCRGCFNVQCPMNSLAF